MQGATNPSRTPTTIILDYPNHPPAQAWHPSTHSTPLPARYKSLYRPEHAQQFVLDYPKPPPSPRGYLPTHPPSTQSGITQHSPGKSLTHPPIKPTPQ